MTSTKTSGRWRPGESGNPAGRRPGSGRVQQLRQSIEDSLPGIIQCLAAKAEAGDVGAARLLLERAIPALKPIETHQPLQIARDDLSGQAKEIVSLAASGAISINQAAQMVAALATVGKLIEVDELERRIQTLESSLAT